MPRAPATQQVLSDDEFDDLDELDSEDEDAGPSQSQSQKQKQNKGLLFGALKKPRPVTISFMVRLPAPGGRRDGARRAGEEVLTRQSSFITATSTSIPSTSETSCGHTLNRWA